jgi:hypothetical protein
MILLHQARLRGRWSHQSLRRHQRPRTTDSARYITAIEAAEAVAVLSSVVDIEDVVVPEETDTVAVDEEMDEAVDVERVEDAVLHEVVRLEVLHAARALHRDLHSLNHLQ